MRREAPRLSFLMCPFCVRVPSSDLTTILKGSEIVSCASAASRQFGSASSVNAVVRKR
jgi:hypothetical protein